MYDLRQHIKSVHENIKLVCDQCAMPFNNRGSLHRHKLVKHNKKPKYVCSICNKEYVEFVHYQSHMNMHNNAKPYACEKCGKDFTYKYSLVRHRLRCIDKAEHVCKICGKALSSEEGLKAHTEGVHGPKNNHCICGKSFSWRMALLRHKKTCMMVLTLMD